jgi:hypothetical protein
MTVSVHWHARHRDSCPPELDTGAQETLLPPWAGIGINAESAAQACVADYFGQHNVWRDWFGDEEWRGKITVVVTAPADIAGKFELDLERIVAATSKRRA